MRRAVAIVAVTAALAGCHGLSYTGYRRGAPKRIDIERTPTEPVIIGKAVRTTGTEVRVRLLAFREVVLERTKHYAALELEGRATGNPILEPVEWLLAPFLSFFPRNLGYDGRTRDYRATWTMEPMILALSPAHSVFTARFTVKIADGEPFPSRTSYRRHNMYLPVYDQTVRYRVLDDARTELSAGTLTTDVHGTAIIPDVPARAVGIELTGAGVSIVLPVEGVPPPVGGGSSAAP